MENNNIERSLRFDAVKGFAEEVEKLEIRDGVGYARAPITSIGVYEYELFEGRKVRELRLPEEVFNPESLATIKNLPMTLQHPRQLIDENFAGIVGRVSGDDLTNDGFRLFADLKITDAGALEAVKSKTVTGLSAGYQCNIEWTSGNWMGVKYDCVQRNIRYNHVAIVNIPRGDQSLQIKTDGICLTQNNGEKQMAEETKALEALEKEYKVKMDGLSEQLTGSKKENEILSGKVDALQAKFDSVNAELAKFKEDSKVESKNALTAQFALMKKATTYGVEFKEDSTEESILKEALLKRDSKINLDGKSCEYMTARLDMLVEQERKDSEAEKATKQTTADVPKADGSDGTAEVSSEKSRQEMIKSYGNKGGKV